MQLDHQSLWMEPVLPLSLRLACSIIIVTQLTSFPTELKNLWFVTAFPPRSSSVATCRSASSIAHELALAELVPSSYPNKYN